MFTAVDPAYTLQANLVDPQRWNRYAYTRNNPLKYVDSDGRVLVLAGSQSAQDQAMSIANSGLFGQQLVIGSDGVASLKRTSVQGPPTERQGALAGALKTASHHPQTTTITLAEGAPDKHTGHFFNADN